MCSLAGQAMLQDVQSSVTDNEGRIGEVLGISMMIVVNLQQLSASSHIQFTDMLESHMTEHDSINFIGILSSCFQLLCHARCQCIWSTTFKVLL